MPEAATPSGGAEGSARPAASQPSTTQQQNSTQTTPGNTSTPATQRAHTLQERIKASIYEPAPDEGRATAQVAPSDVVAKAAKVEPEAPQASPDGEEAQTSETPDAGEAPEGDEASFKSISELAEGLGWDLDKIMALEVPTKINGKDGKVALRDLAKSHQLEGHLNQGLMKLAEERKAYEAERARVDGEIRARVQQVSQVVSLAQKMLDGEFADVNWQDLQRTDPAKFQAMYGAYKMRLDGIQQLNQLGEQERVKSEAEQKAAFEAYRSEQAKLLDASIPEWADKSAKDKDVAEMVATLADAYGFTEQEIRSTVDHRLLRIARDASKWQKLQKSKPATLNKVRAAPKLIRPGAQQSRSAQEGLDAQKGQAALRKSGRVQDATPVLKRLLFNNS